MNKLLYAFNEGNRDMSHILGRKGANLCEMTRMGIPVPYGFILSSEGVKRCLSTSLETDDELSDEIIEEIRRLEKISGKIFGDKENPLILAVRPSYESSIPGMMDSILNIGFNEEILYGFAKQKENFYCAYDSYMSFLRMYAVTALGMSPDKVKEKFSAFSLDSDKKSEAELKEALRQQKDFIYENTGNTVPDDPFVQLIESIKGIIKSWNSERTISYRQFDRNISETLPSVCIQETVFGNSGENSGSGVIFTRNPSTGQKKIFGEFLFNSQGTDIVEGKKIPLPIDVVSKIFPENAKQLRKISGILESHYGDMQEIEFTIENGKLSILQTGLGNRNIIAGTKIAFDMVNEGIIGRHKAISRIDSHRMNRLVSTSFDKLQLEETEAFAKGLPSSPGEVSGILCFDERDVKDAILSGKNAILAKKYLTAEDLAILVNVDGVITSAGGVTSHISTITRRLNKCYVSGVKDLIIDSSLKTIKTEDEEITCNEMVSIDGYSGKIYKGKLARESYEKPPEFRSILEWSDEIRTLYVRADASSLSGISGAMGAGAEGIGIFHSERIMLGDNRDDLLSEVIFKSDRAKQEKDRISSSLYQKLFFEVKEDYKQIINMAEDFPIALKLLDVDDNLNNGAFITSDFARNTRKNDDTIQDFRTVFDALSNNGGFRTALMYPDVYEIQIRAITEAVKEISTEKHYYPKIEIIIPKIDNVNELLFMRNFIKDIISNSLCDDSERFTFNITACIESPRGAVIMGELAEYADSFLFDIGRLTEHMIGISAEYMNYIRKHYKSKNAYAKNPFRSIDIKGVGGLMTYAVETARREKPNVRIGMFGVYSSDPESVDFVNSMGFDYISCSKEMIPLAKIEAARAVVKHESDENKQ